MIFQRCATCTRYIPGGVHRYSSVSTSRLYRSHRQVESQRQLTVHPGNYCSSPWQHSRTLLLQQYTTPYVTIRFYSTDKTPPSSTLDQLPIHLVKPTPDLTKSANHIDLQNNASESGTGVQEKPVGTEKEEIAGAKSEDSVKPEISNNSEPVKSTVEKTNDAVLAPIENSVVPRSIVIRAWDAAKHTALHYRDGAKLLIVEIKISARISKKILQGESLTRRERRQLTRTIGDVFRLIPLAVFVMIPFLEFFLPVALYLFPNLLPSTFETIDKKKEKKLKKLKLKLDLAKFIQESMVSGITLQDGKPHQLERFSEFIARTRSKDPRDDIDELVSFSKLFSEDLTLDNLPRSYIVALCQLVNISTTVHTDMFLRYRLRSTMQTLKEDDKLIRQEGLAMMTAPELQQANIDRGMRAVGVSKERLQHQLDQWLMLSLEQDIPMTLLLLSRVMTLPAGPTVSYEGLRNAVAHLPDSLIGEAKISLASKQGEMIDNRERLEAVKAQEEMIVKEQMQQQKKDIIDQETDRKQEEQKKKEERNTRVAANLQMRKETLKDMAKPIQTEDEIEVRRQEVAEIQQLITSLRDKKNPLLEEKAELRDLIEKALVYHVTVEEGSLIPSKGTKLLSNKVAKMLNHSHKVLVKLEQGLNIDLNLPADDSDQNVVLTKQEIKSAINEILNVDKKEKLLSILEVLSDDVGDKIDTTEVLKGLEKIATEGTDLTQKQVAAVMKLARSTKTSLQDSKQYYNE